MSGDGNTAVVSGWSASTGEGGAWIFTRSGGTWTQQGSMLSPIDASGTAWFGQSAAISHDGNTVAIGGYRDDNFRGAVWIFVRSGGVWTQQGSKLVGTGYAGTPGQGISVAMAADGNTVIIGGSTDNGDGYSDHGIGAAWIFTRSGGVWTQQGSKLVGTGSVGDNPRQGLSVALSADGNTAMVGGYTDVAQNGATWVFVRSGGVWTQQGSKLYGTGVVDVARQGVSVSLSSDGNRAVIGGYYDAYITGAAWLFERHDGSWSQVGPKIVGSGSIGETFQGRFVSLAPDGNTFVMGGFGDDGQTGAGWAFRYDSSLIPVEGFGITSVLDVPSDQGGNVQLTWTAIHLDTNLTTLPYYSIWRSITPGDELPPPPPPASAQGIPMHRPTTINGIEYAWEWIANAPAHKFQQYSYTAATLFDSMAGNTGIHYFLVSAQTDNPNVFYDSNVDSGYSVDNLAPLAPSNVTASVAAGPLVNLSWDNPVETDVAHYTVYRSSVSGFTPSESNSIATVAGTAYADANPLSGLNYYKLRAVDVHGNTGPESMEAPAGIYEPGVLSVNPKWNIVSVPLGMGEYGAASLFPTASTQLFGYAGGYSASATLVNGSGYWAKFTASENITHVGVARTEAVISVQGGWNLIGGLSVPVAVSTIGSVPGGMVTSSFYGYDGGYHKTTMLVPGKGYWVHVEQAGELVLSASGVAPKALPIRIEDRGELPPPPPDGEIAAVPQTFGLEQNYPNPFNPTTSIDYALPVSGHVRLSVFNLLGEEVAVLVDEVLTSGYKTVSFDAGNFASGVYICRIIAGTYTESKRMLLMK